MLSNVALLTLNRLLSLDNPCLDDYQALVLSGLADLETRSPSPLFVSEDGTNIPTDLDLSSVLQALRQQNDRVFVILPTYTRTKPASVNPNEILISRENRRGFLSDLYSNRKPLLLVCVCSIRTLSRLMAVRP